MIIDESDDYHDLANHVLQREQVQFEREWPFGPPEETHTETFQNGLHSSLHRNGIPRDVAREALEYYPEGLETGTLWVRGLFLIVLERGYYGHRGVSWDYSKVISIYRGGGLNYKIQKVTFGPNANRYTHLPVKKTLEYMEERGWLSAQKIR